jgi:hypothetical protein
MSKPDWIDSKLVIWLCGMAAMGIGAWYRLEALGATMSRVEVAMDEQADGLTDHAADPDSHTARGYEVKALATEQTKLESRVERIDQSTQRIELTLATLCAQMGGDCGR